MPVSFRSVVQEIPRISPRSCRNKRDARLIIGAAIAREIGHVLLHSTEHSAVGIFKAKMAPRNFEN